MISYLKNNEGFIYAYAEWHIVNEMGTPKDGGDYVYIQDIWIHENLHNKGVLKELINIINVHPFTRFSNYVYWVRYKYNERMSKYKKILLTRRLKHGKSEIKFSTCP